MNYIVMFEGFPPSDSNIWLSSVTELVHTIPVVVLDFNHSMKRHIHTLATYMDLEHSKFAASKYVVEHLTLFQKVAMFNELSTQLSHRNNQFIIVLNIPKGMLYEIDTERDSWLIRDSISVVRKPPTFLERLGPSYHQFRRMCKMYSINVETGISRPEWDLHTKEDWNRFMIKNVRHYHRFLNSDNDKNLQQVSSAPSRVLLRSLRNLDK